MSEKEYELIDIQAFYWALMIMIEIKLLGKELLNLSLMD